MRTFYFCFFSPTFCIIDKVSKTYCMYAFKNLFLTMLLQQFCKDQFTLSRVNHKAIIKSLKLMPCHDDADDDDEKAIKYLKL